GGKAPGGAGARARTPGAGGGGGGAARRRRGVRRIAPAARSPAAGAGARNGRFSTAGLQCRGQHIRGRPGFDVVESPAELQAEVAGWPRKSTGKTRKCEERTRTRCLT